MPVLQGRRVLLIIGGGIAAYKALELIRRLGERGADVRAILTASAHHFVTPLSVGALTGSRVAVDLFDLDAEHEIGHIRLARDTEIVVVAPATADLLARMAHGLADDLATAVLLATDKPVLAAPAMNPLMWSHPATRRNVERLAADGVAFVGPEAGEMAERGETGVGRLAEPSAIVAEIERLLDGAALDGAAPSLPPKSSPPKMAVLDGLKAIVTSGPTHEPIDPVRYLANRSSGRQGHAIAAALAAAGAQVTLVSGPVEIDPPAGVRLVAVETAREMRDAVEAALPADIAVMAAAVADWRVEAAAAGKLKKQPGEKAALALVENPDILAEISRHARRPPLVVGFAAETEDVVAQAQAKLKRKGCDWIVANDVSLDSGVAGGIMGGERNRVHLITAHGVEDWPDMRKADVAARLVARIAASVGRLPPAPARATTNASNAQPAPAAVLAPVEEPPPAAQLPLADAALDVRPTR